MKQLNKMEKLKVENFLRLREFMSSQKKNHEFLKTYFYCIINIVNIDASGRKAVQFACVMGKADDKQIIAATYEIIDQLEDCQRLVLFSGSSLWDFWLEGVFED